MTALLELTLSLLLLSPEGEGERRTCTGALRLTCRVTGDRDRAIPAGQQMCRHKGRQLEYIYTGDVAVRVCPLVVYLVRS